MQRFSRPSSAFCARFAWLAAVGLTAIPGVLQAEIHGSFSAPAAPASVTAAGVSPAPAAPPSSTLNLPKTANLGTALVFIKAADITPALAAHLSEIQHDQTLTSHFYLNQQDGSALLKQALDGKHVLPGDLDYTIDFGSKIAAAQKAVGQSVIVFTEPNGVVRRYSLVSEYPLFQKQALHVAEGRH